MSLASTLLRVVLMLSLLLNGLNAAMASGHEEMGRMGHAVAAAEDGEADCHHHAGMQAEQAPRAKAPAHDAHCQIKDCVRSCAQHPLLVVQPLPYLAGPALSLAPQRMPANGRPAPPLPPISRPPIG
ncbi:CopL family metal-binding regulatory protein [Stenotrophomonas maltophilia]|uniref:CopL family metal-binding regulatory protein n=1 Tax=Stenotrophomonas maltophilia TaxID=40324 RepID=A0AAJ2JBI0_STEMA|nr:CopL family metal-binding regulatory protein [Stenotrophomonas maltophilia]MBH1365027.1 CopL family metal-binding regulatory protein [Stenotrophomonas maltophilia]MDT3467957.1 CopL family metal-binding regulatory protein [Stenotrophomonas maltophilia]